MEAYQCAYRDTKSPLAPIIPIADSSFTFNQDKIKRIQSPYPKQILLDPNQPYPSYKNPLTPEKRSIMTSENGKQTPFPHKMQSPNFITPQSTPNSNKTYSAELKSPKYLTPQNYKKTPQSSQKRNTPNYYTPQNQLDSRRDITPVERSLTQISYEITPRSRFSEKPQVVGQHQSNYNIKYRKEKMQLKIDGNDVVYKKEKIETYIKPPNKSCQCFKCASPVQPKTLSPRVNKILEDSGMTNYTKLFETEEIDFQVFQMLTAKDLKRLGVNIEEDLDIIVDAVNFWKNDY